jgi:hypothetical protein
MGAERDDYEIIPFLRFDKAAHGIFSEWRADLERRLRSAEMAPALESHLAKYRKLVPALALINHLADGGIGAIAGRAVIRALAFSDEYLETHARRAYCVAFNAETTAAKAILKHIRKGDLRDGFTLREAMWNHWGRLDRPRSNPGRAQSSLRSRVAQAEQGPDWRPPKHNLCDQSEGAPMSKCLDRLKSLKKGLPQPASKVSEVAFETFETARSEGVPENRGAFETFETAQNRHISEIEGSQDANPEAFYPEPRIVEQPHFGVDTVPPRYLGAWEAPLAQCPPSVNEAKWQRAIAESAALFSYWGLQLINLRWMRNDLFAVPHGFAWFLDGCHVAFLGERVAITVDGRTHRKEERL